MGRGQGHMIIFLNLEPRAIFWTGEDRHLQFAVWMDGGKH